MVKNESQDVWLIFFGRLIFRCLLQFITPLKPSPAN
jgi:hypothetical protein